jgi:hypothetical protein
MCQSRKRRCSSEEEDECGGDGHDPTPPPFSDFPEGGSPLLLATQAFNEETPKPEAAAAGRGEAAKRRRRSRWDTDDDSAAVPVSYCIDRGVSGGDGGGFGTPAAFFATPPLRDVFHEGFGNPAIKHNNYPPGSVVGVSFFTPPPPAAAAPYAGNDAAATLHATTTTPWTPPPPPPTTTTTPTAALAATAPALTLVGGNNDTNNNTTLKRIDVGNLNYRMTELDVRSLFVLFGSICRVSMPQDAQLGRHRGFAFVEFADAADADAALRMDGLLIADR